MFIGTLLLTVKKWKPTDEWKTNIKWASYIHTMDYYLAIRNNVCYMRMILENSMLIKEAPCGRPHIVQFHVSDTCKPMEAGSR